MAFNLSAYRVDWPAEASLGRTRFYGVDDSARMEMHLHHGAEFKPKKVPLYERVEEDEAEAPGDKPVVKEENLVFIDYTNYRGERGWRLIDCTNAKTRFGTSQFHTEPQWLMTALDVSKDEEREFAVKDIHETRKAHLQEMTFCLTPKDQAQGT